MDTKKPEWVVFVRLRASVKDGLSEGRYTGHVSADTAEDALNALRNQLQVQEVPRVIEARVIPLTEMAEYEVAPL